MQVQAKKSVEAVQCNAAGLTALLALGGDKVHMGYCAEHDVDCPHLATDEGNIAIEEGSWLVKDGDSFSVLAAAEFTATYNV